MVYKLKWSSFVCAVILTCIFSCLSKAEDGIEPLINPELLKAANLKIVWENQLPIKGEKVTAKFPIKKIRAAENLKSLRIIESRLYCLSDRNFIVSLNRQNGNMIFSKPIAQAGFTVVGFELYNGQILSVIGDKLIELNNEFGQELKSTRFGYSIVCPAARNELYYYLAGADRRVHAIRVKDKVESMKVAADNESVITSVAAIDDYVIFSTEAGNVISFEPDKAIKRWEYVASGAIIGPMTLDGEDVYFSSKDTGIYKFNAKSGTFIWKAEAGAFLEKGPTITPDILYQPTVDKGLAAIDKKTGKRLWQLPEGKDLLAESGNKAYVITSDGKLVVMDNQKAKKIYSVNFEPVSKYAVNRIDSYIYVANDEGHTACIKPIE